MRTIIFLMLFLAPACLQAQLGLKAGINFANVTRASSINSSSRTGFMAGVYLAPPSGGIMSYRTEIIYSKQGYNYKTSTNTGNVNLDYIMLPQLMCINITRFVQLQFGGQLAFLLNAKVDSSNAPATGTGSKAMDAYNRLDYGYAVGAEVHPFKGIMLGARYNVSLGDLYKKQDYSTGAMPSFIPRVDTKNNVVQVFAGWTFGNNSKKQHK